MKDYRKGIPTVANLEFLNDSSINNYIDELDNAINNKDVFNIALSGNYGSGKSTIIQKYIFSKSLINKIFIKKNYFSKKYIVINIGSFLKYNVEPKNINERYSEKLKFEKHDKDKSNIDSEQKSNISKDTNTNTNENSDLSKDNIISNVELNIVDKIEESVLKQLIYRNPSKKMPDSNIKRMPDFSYISLIISVFVFSFIFLLIILWNDNLCYSFLSLPFVNNIYYFDKFDSYITLIYFGILFFIFVFILYKIVDNILFNHKIQSIRVSEDELEFKFSQHMTFDIYLYEILYFFKKNNIKAVFFEDIDRFDDDIVLMVIEELKELNKIINTANLSFLSKKISFVYAFRDNIFNDYKNRNKFYDYMISVMPISTNSNSYFHFKSLINDNDVSNSLLKIISDSVIDYRTLINISNDYKLFKRNLNDYYVLSSNKNSYYINGYDQLLAIIFVKNTDYLLYDKLINNDSDVIKYIKKLNDIFVDKFTYYEKVCSDFDYLFKNNKIYYDKDDFNINDFIVYNFLKIEDNNIFDIYGSELSIDNFDIGKVNDYVFNDDSAKEIFAYYSNNIDLNKAFKDYSFFKRLNEQSNICDKISDFVYKNELKENEKKYNNDIFDRLIIRMYITTDYLDFISLPVSNKDINVKEYNYLKRVENNILGEYIELVNFENLLNYLKYIYFEHDVRNISLLIYLIKNKNENLESDIYNSICNKFYNLDSKKLKFLIELKKTDNYCYRFFLEDILQSKYFYLSFEKLINKFGIGNENLYSIVIDMLSFNDLNQAFFESDIIRRYIESFEKFSRSDFLMSEYSLQNLIKDNVRFSNVENFEDKSLIKANYLYKFYLNNINALSLNFDDENDDFVSYVISNLSFFESELYLINNNYYIKNSNVINRILSKNISENLRIEILKRENFIIDEINDLFPDYTIKHLKYDWNSIFKFNSINHQYNFKKLSDYILDNKSKFFNDNSNIIDINNEEFNVFLLKRLCDEKDAVNLSKYLDNVNVNYKFKFKRSFSNNIICILIEKNKYDVSYDNLKLVIENKDIPSELKRKVLDDYYNLNKTLPIYSKILHYEDCLLSYFDNWNYPVKDLKKLIIDLKIPETKRKFFFKYIFEKNVKYILNKKEVDYFVCKGNVNKFIVSKEKNKYIVKYIYK